VPTKTRSAPSTARPQQQPGREGKVQVKAWVAPELRKRLKTLALELEIPVEALIVQQLEALLKKHGK